MKKYYLVLITTIILSIILTIISSFYIGFKGACIYNEKDQEVYCDTILGFPLTVKLITDYEVPIDYPALSINFIFWFVISFLVSYILIYKVKKK